MRAFAGLELGRDAIPRNPGSTRTDEFAAFEDEGCTPHHGIQLTTNSTSSLSRYAPSLVNRYNALELAHDGQSMASYRLAKDAFVADVLLEVSPSKSRNP